MDGFKGLREPGVVVKEHALDGSSFILAVNQGTGSSR